MNGRLFTIIVAMIVFLVVAFTPIVPLMLTHYGYGNELIARTVIGLLTLGAGYAFAVALLNREPKERDGSIHFRIIPMLAGIAVVLLAWYTDLPKYLADWTGTANYFKDTAEALVPVAVRLWVSILTWIGVIVAKFGIYWQEEVEMVEAKSTKKKKRSEVLDQIDEMDEQ
jgi:hypothetical protein